MLKQIRHYFWNQQNKISKKQEFNFAQYMMLSYI